MTDRNIKVGHNIEVSGGLAGLALLFIFFWGDPDLCDALIYWLMKP